MIQNIQYQAMSSLEENETVICDQRDSVKHFNILVHVMISEAISSLQDQMQIN